MAFGRHPGARRAAPLPLLLFACAGVIGLPAVGWGQFSAHPVVVDFEAGADTARTAITVRNHGRAPLQFRVYVGDFEQESDGSHRFLDAGTHPWSCAARLRAYPSELVIDPGQTRPVVAEMAPGSGTCWSVVWIETMAEAGGGVRVGQRIGVKVHAFEPGAAAGRAGGVPTPGTPVDVLLPNRFAPYEMRADTIWGIELDDLGVPTLRAYRVPFALPPACGP